MHATRLIRISVGDFHCKACTPLKGSWRKFLPFRDSNEQGSTRRKVVRHLGISRRGTRCQAGLVTTLQVSVIRQTVLLLGYTRHRQSADHYLQDLAVRSLQPHPGLASGLLVNTTVFVAGLQVLLQGMPGIAD